MMQLDAASAIVAATAIDRRLRIEHDGEGANVERMRSLCVSVASFALA
jgi:hypothetical protein